MCVLVNGVSGSSGANLGTRNGEPTNCSRIEGIEEFFEPRCLRNLATEEGKAEAEGSEGIGVGNDGL